MASRLPLFFLAAFLVVGAGCSRKPLPQPVGGSASEEGSWPAFHGPRGDNISDETGLLAVWPEGGPTLLWVTDGIGHGFASVSVAQGTVYTAGDVDGQNIVSALDLSGNLRWQIANGRGWTGSHDGSRGTPTIDGDRLYHQSPHGDVASLRVDDGQMVWQTNVLERFGGRTIQWGLAESVVIDGDRLICCPGGTQGSVVALDKMTGETVWAAPPTGSGTGYSTPLLVDDGGIRMILAMSGKSLLGVAAEDGRLLFEFPLPTDYDVHAAMPIWHDGHVVISAGYGTGSVQLRLDRQHDRIEPVEIWRSGELDNHHGGVILWEGHLYGAAHNANRSKWICLEWATGKMRYAEKGVGKGSATLAEGMLYVLSERGNVGLVPATPEGHRIVSQFSLPRGGDGPTWAHPVVCGGCLYLRHGDRLHCYDIREEGQ